MSDTTIERRKDALLNYKIAELRKDVDALKTNQLQKLAFGDIVLNGTSGTISSGSGTIIDGTGFSSLDNFAKGQILNASSPTINSATYTDIPGSTMSGFNLSRQANVFIYFIIDGYMTDFNVTNQEYLNVAFVDNGSTVLQSLFVTGNLFLVGTDAWVGLEFATQVQFVTLAAGPHQFKLQGKIDNFRSGDTGLLQNWGIGYIIFGD